MLRRLDQMFREDLSRNFGFILHDVARLLRTTFDRRVKSLGLTRSQGWVLNHLFRNDGMTQSDLADLLQIEKATLGRLLDRLEAKGWVRREADAADRRVRRVFLTPEVEPALKEMRTAAAEVRRDALAGVPRRGRRALRRHSPCDEGQSQRERQRQRAQRRSRGRKK